MRKMLFQEKWREVKPGGLLGKFLLPDEEGDEMQSVEVVSVSLPEGERCPCCGSASVSREKCFRCDEPFLKVKDVQALASEVVENLGARARYKVITQRDEFFGGKFNPERLATLLNMSAAEGWRVVCATATDVGSFWGSFWNKGGGAARQELVIIMEKVEPP